MSQHISISFCQNKDLYQSLPHAQGEVPEDVLKKDLARPRSGFMGRLFVRIFGFSDSLDFVYMSTRGVQGSFYTPARCF